MPNEVMIWRRNVDQQLGKSSLTLLKNQDIDLSKNTIIFFPSTEANHKWALGEHQEDSLKSFLSGYLKRIEHLLGGRKIYNFVQMLILSYPSDSDQCKENLRLSNQSPLTFSCEEARNFSQQYLLPLIKNDDDSNENLKKITFVAASYGSSFVLQVQIALVEQLKERGFSVSRIQSILSTIVLFSSSNVSRSVENGIGNFTSFYFMNMSDQLAQRCLGSEFFEMFQQKMPLIINNAIFKTSNNSLLVWQRDFGTTAWIFKESESNGMNMTCREDKFAHASDLYLTKRPETSILQCIMQRVLSHAVQRFQYQTQQTLTEYLSPTSLPVEPEIPQAHSLPCIDYKKKLMPKEMLSMVDIGNVPIIDCHNQENLPHPAKKNTSPGNCLKLMYRSCTFQSLKGLWLC